MKIQSTQLNNHSKPIVSNNISYGHKSAYTYLKNVPGNCCACCGKEMIPSKDISATWSRITRPLSVVLKEGRFDFAEMNFPALYKVLTNFAAMYPDKSLDTIISDFDCHGIFMDAIVKSFNGDIEHAALLPQIQDKEIKNRKMTILKVSSSIMKDSAEVIENLKPLDHYLYGYQKDLFQELEYLSRKYPDKKLYEIIRYPEVAEKYVEKTYFEAIEFAKIRDEHWNKANKIILDRAPELNILAAENEDEKFMSGDVRMLAAPFKKLNAGICRIYRGIIDPKRVAYKIQEAYKNFMDKYKLDDIKDLVLAEISQMPTQLFSKNSFLSFARRYYSDGEIIDYVIKPFMESVERINSFYDGGTNAASNIIMMCRKCNEDRKNYSYSEHLAIHPEMVANTKKQIDFYAEKILSGEIPIILRNYPIKVAKNLYTSSGGLINYNVASYKEALAQKMKSNT